MPETRVLLNSFAILWHDVGAAVRQKGHKLILCKELEETYYREVERNDATMLGVLATQLAELRQGGSTITMQRFRKLPPKAIGPLPHSHPEFLQWAVGERVQYFVTEREEWLALTDCFRDRHAVTILNAGAYIADP